MGEVVIVRQNSKFETEILSLDPHDPDDHQFHPVDHIHYLTPYGMLLAGLGSCTAIVLHTYAQHHGVNLREVELRLQYDRVFADDCVQCEGIQEYKEEIAEEIVLTGGLAPQERKRLFAVSKHCPIHKMLIGGITVQSRLAEGP
ncbi:MAG: OsmC family protein [Anaerolineae bacterium]